MLSRTGTHGFILRLVLEIALWAAAIFGPSWLLVLTSVLLALLFGAFEPIAAAMLFDIVHVPAEPLFGIGFPFTAMVLLATALALLIRTRLQ